MLCCLRSLRLHIGRVRGGSGWCCKWGSLVAICCVVIVSECRDTVACFCGSNYSRKWWKTWKTTITMPPLGHIFTTHIQSALTPQAVKQSLYIDEPVCGYLYVPHLAGKFDAGITQSSRHFMLLKIKRRRSAPNRVNHISEEIDRDGMTAAPFRYRYPTTHLICDMS